MQRLPLELQEQILDHVPVKDVVRYCKTSKETLDVCYDKRYWIHRTRHELGVADRALAFSVTNPVQFQKLSSELRKARSMDISSVYKHMRSTIYQYVLNHGQRGGDGQISRGLVQWLNHRTITGRLDPIDPDIVQEFVTRFNVVPRWKLLFKHGNKDVQLQGALELGLDETIRIFITHPSRLPESIPLLSQLIFGLGQRLRYTTFLALEQELSSSGPIPEQIKDQLLLLFKAADTF